jgi:hypothetical protein
MDTGLSPQKAQTADINVPGLAPATQGLARVLAVCVLGDKELQSEVTPLLREQDREIAEERSAGLEPVIPETRSSASFLS